MKDKRYNRKSPKLLLLLRIVRVLVGMTLLIAGIVAFCRFYEKLLGGRLDIIISGSLGIDIYLLCYFLIYLFVSLSLGLIFISYWSERDVLRFRMKQMKYRSSLMAKDYYQEHRNIKYGTTAQGLDRPASNKLDLSGKEIDEHALANLDPDSDVTVSGAIAFKDGKLEGVFISNFANGNVESQVSYHNGKLDGPSRTFYPDGRLRAERFYKEGKLHGLVKAYDEDGSIFFEVEYKDGQQNGIDKTYYRSGALEYLDTYKGGRRVHRKTYDEGGNLKFEEDFE